MGGLSTRHGPGALSSEPATLFEPGELRDWFGFVVRAADEEEPERLMLAYLRKNLIVQVKGAEVTIAFDWPEPKTAFEVMQTVQEKLLASRREAELDPLERKAESLEASAAQAKARIDAGVLQIDAAVKARRRGARAPSVR